MVLWQRLALGVMSGDMTVPALSNADDMVLKAPSGDALQDLITRCEAYAREYDIMHTTHHQDGVHGGSTQKVQSSVRVDSAPE